jgi:hypothetical protein
MAHCPTPLALSCEGSSLRLGPFGLAHALSFGFGTAISWLGTYVCSFPRPSRNNVVITRKFARMSSCGRTTRDLQFSPYSVRFFCGSGPSSTRQCQNVVIPRALRRKLLGLSPFQKARPRNLLFLGSSGARCPTRRFYVWVHPSWRMHCVLVSWHSHSWLCAFAGAPPLVFRGGIFAGAAPFVFKGAFFFLADGRVPHTACLELPRVIFAYGSSLRAGRLASTGHPDSSSGISSSARAASTYGISSSFPVVFRPSRSRCACAASLSL